jgi:predicted dehydrogenase
MSFVSRREFAGAAAMTALSVSRVMGANETIRVGVIGCGGMANGHMNDLIKMKESDNVQVTAVCDVYQKRLESAEKKTGGKPFKDYRALLADKDIDYVLIATPEHWHYQMAVDAVAAGKHVYCEKPMTQTSEEAKKLYRVVKANPKIKFQVGVQGMSDESYAEAYKHVKDGTLGKVVMAQIDYSRNHLGDQFFDMYPKGDGDIRPGENFDWQAWQGSRPKKQFDPDRFLNWRRYYEYSSGIASDLFVHRVTRIIKSLNLGFPEYACGAGGKFQWPQGKGDIPDTLNLLIDYPGGPTVQLVSSMANGRKVDHVLRGHKGTLEFTSTGFTITPEPQYREGAQVIEYKKTGAESRELHHRNLMNAIRRGDPLNCDAELGYKAVVAVELGSLSFRRRKYMKWDAAKERIVPA